MQVMRRRMTLLIMVSALLMTVSCAKKNVVTDSAGGAAVAAAEDVLDSSTAGGMALEEQAAEEAQRLQEAALQDAARAEEKAVRKAFENQDVLFDYDSAVLTWEAQQILKDKARWMAQNFGVNVVVQGHCDERGTTEYNLALGERRANAVKLFLMDMGISGARITTISYGEEKPVDPGHSEAAWARNRRAHFVIL